MKKPPQKKKFGRLEPLAGLESDDESVTGLTLEKRFGEDGPNDEEFEEMVPDFMHRDFYRSNEDGLDVVEPSGLVKAIKPKEKEPLVSLRSSHPNQQPVSPSPPQVKTPLRTLPATVPVVVPEKDPPSFEGEPIREKRSAAFPAPAKTSQWNFPLIICLLLLVGLFLWREQTRPELSPQLVENGVPGSVKEEGFGPNSGGLENVMPDVMAPKQDEFEKSEPVQESEAGEVQEAEAFQEEGRTGNEFRGDDASQRAAVLERLKESTSTIEERESDLEESIESIELKPEDDSLFPSVPDEAPPTEVVSEDQVQSESEPLVLDESLFPGEGAEVAPPPDIQVEPPPLNIGAPSPSQPAIQGEPYQIAEPDL